MALTTHSPKTMEAETDLRLHHIKTRPKFKMFPSPSNIRSRVQKVSGLTYKSRVKWKMLCGIYSAIYGEINVSVEKCAEIKGDCVEK